MCPGDSALIRYVIHDIFLVCNLSFYFLSSAFGRGNFIILTKFSLSIFLFFGGSAFCVVLTTLPTSGSRRFSYVFS